MVIFALIVLALFASQTLYADAGAVPGAGRSSPSAPSARSNAVLAVKKVQPVVIVVGTRFKPNELVRVTGVGTKRVRASAKGRFTVRFPNTDPCGGFTIVAVGSKGSRAALNFSQLFCADP